MRELLTVKKRFKLPGRVDRSILSVPRISILVKSESKVAAEQDECGERNDLEDQSCNHDMRSCIHLDTYVSLSVR